MGRSNSASSLHKPLLAPNKTEDWDEEGGGIRIHKNKNDSRLRLQLRTVPRRFSHIPGTEGLSWKDDFFDGHGHENVIAVFDKDIERMEDYYDRVRPISYCIYGFICCLPFLHWVYLFHNSGLRMDSAMCQLFASSMLFHFNLLLNINHAMHKGAECSKGQHIAVTTDGLMTVRFDRWMMSRQIFVSLLIPRFVLDLSLPEPKISKFRYSEIQSCTYETRFIHFLQREHTSISIKLKGQCSLLYGDFFEYPDAFVELVNHLKEKPLFAEDMSETCK